MGGSEPTDAEGRGCSYHSDGVSADTLNGHYGAILTDHHYSALPLKCTAASVELEIFNDFPVFKGLEVAGLMSCHRGY